MEQIYKQGIDDGETKKLEAALREFISKHKPGHPGLDKQIHLAEAGIRQAMERAGEGGSALVGAAKALLSFIPQVRESRMKE